MRENDKTDGTEGHSKENRSRRRLAEMNEPSPRLALLLSTDLELVAGASLP
jgi:hypothetical protein